jgi:hypothetical protein
MINSSRVCIINEPYLKGDKENIYLPHSKHDIYKKKKIFSCKETTIRSCHQHACFLGSKK